MKKAPYAKRWNKNLVVNGMALSTHELIRNDCIELSIEKAFEKIASLAFCNREGVEGFFPLIKINELKQICKFLYYADQKGWIVSSCYSISLTLFYFGTVFGHKMEIIMGVRKIDERLVGHAWVKCDNEKILNPGNFDIDSLSIIKTLSLKDGLESWLQKCA